uniref:Doublecortin domain-containing protein n=1 Tax=Angiostrongylus cantonensis TaxID=6313 RepID=A0A158P5V8_ANGCA
MFSKALEAAQFLLLKSEAQPFIIGKLDLPYGAKKLYTFDGRLVRHLAEVEDKHTTLAVSFANLTPFRQTAVTNMAFVLLKFRSGLRRLVESLHTAKIRRVDDSSIPTDEKHISIQIAANKSITKSNAHRRQTSYHEAVTKQHAVEKNKREKGAVSKAEEKSRSGKEATADEKRKKQVKEKEDIAELKKNTTTQTEVVLPSSKQESDDNRKYEEK